VIVHSTFLDAGRFCESRRVPSSACARGVKVDLLWGAWRDEETERRSGEVVVQLVREDSGLNGGVTVHAQSAGSHAKILLADRPGGSGSPRSAHAITSPFGRSKTAAPAFRQLERSFESLSAAKHDPCRIRLLAHRTQAITGVAGASILRGGFAEIAAVSVCHVVPRHCPLCPSLHPA
jgi:hypothetical protein